MRCGFASLLAGTLVMSAISASGHQAPPQRPAPGDAEKRDSQDKASLWMQLKLGATQKILEGMTRGDYELVEKHAKAMQSVGHLEGWMRSDLPEYKAQLRAFDHANGALVRAAQDRNLDGVTIAYAQLTISCVQCHKVVRDPAK